MLNAFNSQLLQVLTKCSFYQLLTLIVMETSDALKLASDGFLSSDKDLSAHHVHKEDDLDIEKNVTSLLMGGCGGGGGLSKGVEKGITVIKDNVPSLSCSDDEEKKPRQKFLFECEYCMESFASSKVFKSHCKIAHGVTHPYKCTHCEEAFTHKSMLKVHTRTHKDTRPFSCEQCGATFCTGPALASHMIRHRGISPYVCEICTKSFVCKGELKTHHRIHEAIKPFQCKECGLSFPRKSNYTRHIRKHTGEKPYACSFCSKRFARSEKRVEHERTHTNERPYTCRLCDAKFKDSGNFSTHKRGHANHTKTINTENETTEENGDLGVDKMNVMKPILEKARREKPVHKPRKPTRKNIIPSPEPEVVTINLVRRPLVDPTKNVPRKESVTQVLVTIPDVLKENETTTGFIKLSDTLVQPEQTTVTTGTTESEVPSTPLPNEYSFQYPDLLNTAPIANYSNCLNGQGFNMMLDYSCDTSYTFHNDATLILPDNSSSNPLTGSDEYIYGSSMAPRELTNHNALHQLMFTREESDVTSLGSASLFPLDGADERDRAPPPLDTSKFLNEQYLMTSAEKPKE